MKVWFGWLRAAKGTVQPRKAKKFAFLAAVPLAVGCLLWLVLLSRLWAGGQCSAKERQTRRATNPTIQLYFSLCLPQPAFQPAEKKRSLIGLKGQLAAFFNLHQSNPFRSAGWKAVREKSQRQLHLPSIFIFFKDDWIDWKSLLLAGGAALSFSFFHSQSALHCL